MPLRMLALVAWLTASSLFAPAAGAALPEDDPIRPSGPHCVARAPLPQIENVVEASWAPDGVRMAIVSYELVSSERAPGGYEERDLLQILDIRTGTRRTFGEGDRPQWSGSGAFISYWGPDGDELRVTRHGRTIVGLTPTIPEVRWVGDTLYYIERDEIRSWSDRSIRTVARLPEDLVPRYPVDDVFWSGDGTRFTLTRYSPDGTLRRYVGLTATGELAPLEDGGARYLEWAPRGAALLLRHDARLELRDLGGEGHSGDVAIGGNAVHVWPPAGREPLVGHLSPATGTAFDPFGPWALPNLLGARGFSPDGRYFSGVGGSTARLELYGCVDVRPAVGGAPAPSAAALVEGAAPETQLIRPVAGPVTQFFRRGHAGVDLWAPLGSPIVASADGVVSVVGWVAFGGERVCIDHGRGLETCYYHSSLPLVAEGDRVVRGQPIALVGMTGLVTGPHVHWEAKLFGRTIDPLSR